MTRAPLRLSDSKLPQVTSPLGSPAGRSPASRSPEPSLAPASVSGRPGECSIDVMAVVHVFKFRRGPNPSSSQAIWEAVALGLVTTMPAAVTPRGEQALQEHGWLAAGETEQPRATA